LLGARGYQARGPTLAGVGERINELSAAIVLDTHIRDIGTPLEARDLWNVILVGHSYAGAVILGVADRLPQPLKALVFLDAVVIAHGGSMRWPSARSRSGR
jgi:pimeloyl-ACP methyl ester carboxylesterase